MEMVQHAYIISNRRLIMAYTQFIDMDKLWKATHNKLKSQILRISIFTSSINVFETWTLNKTLQIT